jgi:hypothetical protein
VSPRVKSNSFAKPDDTHSSWYSRLQNYRAKPNCFARTFAIVVLANPEVADKLKFASLLLISIFAAICSAGGGLLGFLS